MEPAEHISVWYSGAMPEECMDECIRVFHDHVICMEICGGDPRCQ